MEQLIHSNESNESKERLLTLSGGKQGSDVQITVTFSEITVTFLKSLSRFLKSLSRFLTCLQYMHAWSRKTMEQECGPHDDDAYDSFLKKTK